MNKVSRTGISEVEFAAIVKASDRRLELWDGEIFDMSYATPAHRDIVKNLYDAFTTRLKAPCSARQNEPIRPPKTTGLYREPDLTIICGERRIQALHGLVLTVNPIVIVEVVSPESERWDRNEKLDEYREIKTLRDYLIVSQRSALINHWTRSGRSWRELATVGLGSSINLSSVSVELLLKDVYRGITFK